MGILSVIIDSREPAWAKTLKFGGVPTVVQALEVGDYWLATEDNKILIIERKTPDDFIGSIMDQRIFWQASQMSLFRDEGFWPYLVITGPIQRKQDGNVYTTMDRKFSWNAAQGAKLSIQELGIPIIECAGDTDFEQSLIHLANRSREAVKIKPIRKPSFMSGQEIVLCGLPGIGPDTVGKVLDYCGTAAWAIAELTDEESKLKIPGVGMGIKNNVRWALGLKEDEILAVINKNAEIKND